MCFERGTMFLKNILCRHAELIRNQLGLNRPIFGIDSRFEIAEFSVSRCQCIEAQGIAIVA